VRKNLLLLLQKLKGMRGECIGCIEMMNDDSQVRWKCRGLCRKLRNHSYSHIFGELESKKNSNDAMTQACKNFKTVKTSRWLSFNSFFLLLFLFTSAIHPLVCVHSKDSRCEHYFDHR